MNLVNIFGLPALVLGRVGRSTKDRLVLPSALQSRAATPVSIMSHVFLYHLVWPDG